MAEPSARKLRLKRENAPLERALAAIDPVARILVDTGVTHLNEPYDYLVSELLDTHVQPGALVEVHFGNRVTQGYVLERLSAPTSGLKFIDSVISSLPIYQGELRALIEKGAKRYACSPWDVIGTAIPSRTISVEKRFSATNPIPTRINSIKSVHKQTVLTPGQSYVTQLLDLMCSAVSTGSVLLVVPDYADLQRVSERVEAELGQEALVFNEELTKSERYRFFLRAWSGEAKVIVGTRSAIFTPLPAGSTIIVYSENEPSHWEKRHPGWNTRDIALLRAGDHSLHFVSHSPSLEILRLAHSGWLQGEESKRTKDWNPRITYEATVRTPERVIREALSKCSVLMTIARKGYINSFSCIKCRNIAHCSCGARLKYQSAGEIVCPLCSNNFSHWKCDHCGGSTPRALSRGGERLVEELRISFSNIPIVFSKADHRVPQHSGPGIVVATNGAEPMGEYAAVLLMDGPILFSSLGLRDDEEAKRAWFSAAAMANGDGEIYISFPVEDPISQSLTRWSVEPIATAELHERNSAGLPPYFRIATLTGPQSELESLKSTFSESSLFSHVSISTTGNSDSILHLRAPIERSSDFEEFFASFQRVRSLKSLPLIAVRIDPYSF